MGILENAKPAQKKMFETTTPSDEKKRLLTKGFVLSCQKEKKRLHFIKERDA